MKLKIRKIAILLVGFFLFFSFKAYCADAKKYFERGEAYQNKEKYKKAIAAYTKAIELKPDYIKAYTRRGYAFKGAREYNKGISDARKVMELDPKSGEAHNLVGNCYLDMNLPKKAIISYNKALELNRHCAYPFNRGLAYARLQDYASALKSFNESLAINPNYHYAHYERLYIILRRSRPNK